MKKKHMFSWNVLLWDVNHDDLEIYDVVPVLLYEYERLKKKDRPKTRQELSDFLDREAMYHFWSKCEYEIIVHNWPKFRNDRKVDAYAQLKMNWDAFVDGFWNKLCVTKGNQLSKEASDAGKI